MGIPVVSFVIPVLNGEQYIERCLKSIRGQNYPQEGYEIIVVDNGSTDDTLKIIRRCGVIYEVVPKLHVSALRNYGVAKSKGRYLAFIDADVEIGNAWITQGVQAVEKANVVAVGSYPMVSANATWVQRAWDLHQRGRRSEIGIRPIAWLPSMNLLVKRHEFLAIGGFNEKLLTAEDVDLCYRLKEQGEVMCHVGMQAIHWGEAPDLRTFWRKEVWRGLGSLQGVASHGLRWDELPSLGYPLYYLLLVPGFVLSMLTDFWGQQVYMAPLGFVLLVTPPFLLAAYTTIVTKSPSFLPHLFILYLNYGLARAYAMVKAVFCGNGARC